MLQPHLDRESTRHLEIAAAYVAAYRLAKWKDPRHPALLAQAASLVHAWMQCGMGDNDAIKHWARTI